MRTFKPEIDVRRLTETSVRPYSGADHPYAAEIALVFRSHQMIPKSV